MNYRKPSALLAGCLLFCSASLLAQRAKLVVDVTSPGPAIPTSMYGVFFEEINHSGDGGLYAELIQNRGFEDRNLPSGTRYDSGFAIAPALPNYRSGQVRNFRIPWKMDNLWPAWTLSGGGQAALQLVTDNPLHPASPHSLQISIEKASADAPVELANEGFWGIGVKSGDRYNLRFYLRTGGGTKGDVVAKLVGADGKVLGQQRFVLKAGGNWNEYTGQLAATGTDAKARLVLRFSSPGTVWVDYVSLFPANTFKNRKNGLRTDVAQLLADLKPAFIRWPGGCIVEGLTLENRVKWKETLGDPMTRPGEYDLWGYRNSYGFGYHEFLQFCEDIGAKGMFVANIGLSCSVRNGDFCKPEEVGSFVQEALDAIEYAIGDARTTWGAKRAAAGHPAPFPLQYVEIGNEDAGVEIYNERYNIFHKAISEKFPQIAIISNHGLNDNTASVKSLGMIDPHYYVAPDWFYTRANNLFDNINPRPQHTAYVGEYAVNRNVGAGNAGGALSEAAFLIGAERNADFVKMLSYAPLIENSNRRDWPVNLIWVNSEKALGRSSYYVQKLFAHNRPDKALKTVLHDDRSNEPKEPFAGYIGFATNRAQAEFKDLRFNGSSAQTTFAKFEAGDGQWSVSATSYVQNDTGGRHLSFLRSQTLGNGVLEFKMQKKPRAGNPAPQGGFGGGGGFGRFGSSYSFLFGAMNDKNYYQVTFSNRVINLEKIVNGATQYVMDPVRFTLDDNKEYAAKLVTVGDKLELFIDEQPVLSYTYAPYIRHYAIAGIDSKSNEIVVKVVNGEATPFRTTIELAGAGKLARAGQVITLVAAAETDENSFDNLQKVAPKTETFSAFGPSFDMEFKPYSLTVLRIKKQ